MRLGMRMAGVVSGQWAERRVGRGGFGARMEDGGWRIVEELEWFGWAGGDLRGKVLIRKATRGTWRASLRISSGPGFEASNVIGIISAAGSSPSRISPPGV